MARSSQATGSHWYRILRVEYRVPTSRPPVGRLHLPLERRPHHCSTRSLHPAHLPFHYPSNRETRHCHRPTPHYQEPQHCRCNVDTTHGRRFHDGHGLISPHLVPNRQECQRIPIWYRLTSTNSSPRCLFYLGRRPCSETGILCSLPDR